MKSKQIPYLKISSISLLSLLITLGYAAPGQIADEPLFTAGSGGGGSASNIFFQIDDSGSMYQDVLIRSDYWPACTYDPENIDNINDNRSCLTRVSGGGFFNVGSYYTKSDDAYIFGRGYKLLGVTDSTISPKATDPIQVNNGKNDRYDWRIRASDFNILYYNPNVTYLPWKNGDGTSMPDASFTAVKTDPLGLSPFAFAVANPGTKTLDLTNFEFEIAHDTHGYSGIKPSTTNGGTRTTRRVGSTITIIINQVLNRTEGGNKEIDFWDEHTHYIVENSQITQEEIKYIPTAIPINKSRIGTSNTYIVTNNQTLGMTVTKKTLTSGLNGRSLAQEKQNIANWYQYYRTRINVVKGAVSQVMDANPNYRYGLNLIWNGLFVEVPPKNASDYITKNKALLAALFKQPVAEGTPLPDALDRVGRYFKHLPIAAAKTSITYSAPTASGSDGVLYADPIISQCQQNFALLMTDGYWNKDLGTAQSSSIYSKGGFTNVGNSDGDAYSNTIADIAHYYYKNDLSAFPNTMSTTEFDQANWQHLITYSIAFGLHGKLIAGDNGWPDPPLSESSNWGDPTGFSDKPEKLDDLWHAAYNSRGLFISASSPEQIAEGFKRVFDNISKRSYKGTAAAVSFNTTTLSSNSAVFLGQFSRSIEGDWTGDVLAFSIYPALPGTYTSPTTPIDSTKLGEVSSTAKWKAADQLAAKADPVCQLSSQLCETKRNIFTYNHSLGKGVPFQWAALSDSQRDDLGTNPDGSISAGSATAPNPQAFARLAYLRGDTRNESGKNGQYEFKKRSLLLAGQTQESIRLLGDVVHSDPAFVGSPPNSWASNWPSSKPFPLGSSSYASYQKIAAKRTEIVYVGANDGMLHGFKADDGSELMAYIPNAVYASGNGTTGLHYLTDLAYQNNHRYYVDAPSTVADVYMNNWNGKTGWRTLLIGGEMAGGKGIFALDVTDPTVFTENDTNAPKIALWEFDNQDDPDMGYSFATPSVVMMPNGKWAVILGNGYNNTNSGQAALYVLFIDKGMDGQWTDGSLDNKGQSTTIDYIKIVAPTDSDAIVNKDCTATGSNCNGLSTPQPYSTQDNGVTDRIYAGDLKGNLWAFDVSDLDPTNWRVASCPKSGTGRDARANCQKNNIKPLFTATQHSASQPNGKNPMQVNSKPQPITSRPAVVDNANVKVASFPNLLIAFGTGQYLVADDPTTNDIQSYYGVWDHGVYGLTPANLIEQTFLPGPFYAENSTQPLDPTPRVLSKNLIAYQDSNRKTDQGWFINFDPKYTKVDRERMVVDPDVLQGRYLFFNTWIPGLTSKSTNACSTSGSAGGTGYLMNVDLFTGSGTPQPVVDVNNDGLVDESDKVAQNKNSYTVSGVAFGQGLPASSNFFNGNQYTAGTDSATDGMDKKPVKIGNPIARMSWQELNN